MTTKLSRRQFMTSMAAAGLATAGGGWLTNRLWAMVQEGSLQAPHGAGVERWVPTLCRLCPAGCGIRVRLVDGLPVGLQGNRNNPVSAGGLCPAGLAGLQGLVHPDRLRSPMRREGPRGSGRWTAITWDEALEQIAAPLRKLREEGRPEAFAVLEGGDTSLTRFWLERVLRAYGSPNLLLEGSHESWRTAWKYVAGTTRTPAADLANSDFIVSFGHELFETDGHPVWQSKVWGQLRGPAASRPATLAYVGTRVTPTAARADLMLAVRPGQEAILALGLIYTLMMEDLVDRSFLDRWTSDFQRSGGASTATGRGFADLVRQRFSLEEISRRTGVAAGEIFRLGRAFGLARAPIALAGPSVLNGENGFPVAMAVVALNLVVGSVGRAGGYVAGGDAPLSLTDQVEPDAVARRGLATPRVDGAGSATLAAVENSPSRMVTSPGGARPSPIKVLLVHGVNPLHDWPGGAAIERVLTDTELLIEMVSIPDETARHADLLLPESSFLESWGLQSSTPALPLDYAGLQQPAIAPLYESRSFEDAWFALARRIGGPAAAAVPAGSFAEWLPVAASGLLAAGRGTLTAGASEEDIAGFMEARGWRIAGPETPAAFWQGLRRVGAWVDVPHVERSPADLLGPGIEHFSLCPDPLLRDVRKLTGTHVEPLAVYTGPPGPADENNAAKAAPDTYPLRLLLFDTNTLWGGRTALTPLMLEMTGHRQDVAWDSWVEIHPETAARLRIEEGDQVRLESPVGSLVTRALVAPVVPVDVVAMPRGLGHRDFGRFANGVGANPLPLVPPRTDAWTGAPVLAALVRITRAPE
jgi:anaerobic selenocysteine-containing dehydrogenase